MADQTEPVSLVRTRRFRIGVGIVVVLAIAVGAWLWYTAGQESTDDAQVDGHIAQIAARVGGKVQQVHVVDNQLVKAGDLLVELDPTDYQIAVDRAQAALADAQAAAVAAQSGVPITSTTTTSNVTTAQGGLAQATSGVAAAQKAVDAAHARVAAAQAGLKQAQANATKATRDVERLQGLLKKDEVSQQQFDAARAAADAASAAVESARAQISVAEAGVPMAESQLAQARAAEQQAHAALQTARTAPQQVTQIRAKADAAEAQVKAAKAALDQAQQNLAYTKITAPFGGVVSRKTVELGQVIQSGQPLMAITQLDDVWVTANFKETQLEHMRPGQPATIEVDAFPGRDFKGHVQSIAAATGARFSLLPPENATGNYVKVVQRVPVKILLDKGENGDHVLRPGMSVTPTVNTSK
jgi:membrane fusion protein (multidrug efflux system)